MLKNTCDDGEMLALLLSRQAGDLRLIGAEDTDGDADEKSDETEETEDDADGDNDADGDGDDDDDESPELVAANKRIAILEERNQRDIKKRKEAIARADKAEKDLAELRKTGSSDETLKARIDELEAENATLKSGLNKSALATAFLKDNTHQWVDPDAALRLANLDDVEIEADGTVTGLDVALSDLAKKSPYLLKTDKKQPPARKSGEKPGGQGSGGTRDKATEAKAKADLIKKYPGLRR